MAIRLIILGLRRSGTTIFWQMFRQDPRLTNYDEPFNPLLYRIPSPESGKNPQEFVALFERDPRRFWELYAPIAFTEELRDGLTDRQRAWLRHVGESGEHVTMDVTRCHYKIEALKEIAPDAALVHLYRPAPSHASSHMLPSDAGLRAKAKKSMRRRGFWTRSGDFDSWSFERIVGTDPRSAFGHRLADAGLDPGAVYRLPAVGKLLAYWKIHRDRIEADGPKHFGPRYVSVEFDAFCREPQAVFDRVYAAMGLERPEMRFDAVHPPNGPYQADDPRWGELLAAVGLPADGA